MLKTTPGQRGSASIIEPLWTKIPCSFAFAWMRSVCSFGTGTASFSTSSATVA